MADDPGEDPIMSAFTPAAKKRQQRSEEQERIEAMVAEFQRQMAGMEQKLTELSMENDILVRKLQRKVMKRPAKTLTKMMMTKMMTKVMMTKTTTLTKLVMTVMVSADRCW